jgi:glyoxylase-like metal-dependent hydrolase (beta-lactamase superfamily II)
MSERYRFNVGNFRCIAVNDGTFAYPHPTQDVFINFFVNAPKERLTQVLKKHDLDPEKWDEYVSPYNCLVIDTGQHKVLVDTGAGGLAPTTGKLLHNLKAEGIAPEDIDKVVLTHAHPDHIGGNTDGEGNPAFPNARYVMWKNEWDFWTKEPDLEPLKIDQHGKEILVKMALNNLPPIRDRIELVNRETEIVSGIRAIPAPGHTPGHMAVAVVSENEQLIHISDAILHPIHIEQTEWVSAVAYKPEQVVATRHKLLEKAASEKALVLATHLPFPGIGNIVRKAKRWQWQPIKRA